MPHLFYSSWSNRLFLNFIWKCLQPYQNIFFLMLMKNKVCWPLANSKNPLFYYFRIHILSKLVQDQVNWYLVFFDQPYYNVIVSKSVNYFVSWWVWFIPKCYPCKFTWNNEKQNPKRDRLISSVIIAWIEVFVLVQNINWRILRL